MTQKSSAKFYSLCVSEIGADYDGGQNSDDEGFVPMNSVGENGIYVDDIVKDLPDLTFYEAERKGANPEGLKSKWPVVAVENISLFVTDAERAGAAAKRKRLSHKIFMQCDWFGHFLTFFTVFTIFADD
jgi:hypothetical protein